MSFIELGKRIPIGAPAQRPLTPVEQRVYDLLQEGRTDFEIARLLHIRVGSRFELQQNVNDIPVISVYNIIISIREKGYEIPKKEENNLENTTEHKPYKRLTEEQKAEILRLSGTMSSHKIAKKLGVGQTTVSRIICSHKNTNEPAAAATVTDSKETVQANVSEDIIPDTGGDVKTPRLDFYNSAEEKIVIRAIVDHLNEYSEKIVSLTESIKRYERERDILCDLLNRNGYGNTLTKMDGGES